MSSTCIRRIVNEVSNIKETASEYANMFRIEIIEDNIYHWIAYICGPSDTLYEGYEFQLDILIPNTYPNNPPNVKFVTPIKHLNVNDQGDICLDIINKNWGRGQSIQSLLISIISLLSDPNPSDPLNSNLGELYRRDINTYNKIIIQCCEANAKKYK